jgi:hypothetical protein
MTYVNPELIGSKIAKFKHIIEPYGWVKMENCELEERTFEGLKGTYKSLAVVGRVVESRWNGVMFAGVAITKASSDQFPIGSQHVCRVTNEYEITACERREIR